MIRQQTSVHASEEAGDERLRPLGSRPVALRVMVLKHRHGFRLRNEKIALPLAGRQVLLRSCASTPDSAPSLAVLW